MKWMWLSRPPAVTIMFSPAITSVEAATTSSGSTPSIVSGFPALPAFLELNADALLMDQMYHMPGFLGDYIEYVCERNARNSELFKARRPLERIESPYERAK